MEIVTVTPAPVPDSATEHRVPMRDGVALATDVYLPDDSSPAPVVLVRLPYDKNGEYCFMDAIAAAATRRGYAAVIQDVRGKFRSEGPTEFGIHEVEDGFDTIEWITTQEWCNGDVVMIGDSYYGLTQLSAVVSEHPALKAIAPRLTGTALSTVVQYADGGREPEPTLRRGYFASHYVDRDTYDWKPDWSARPLEQIFEPFFTTLGRRSPDYDHERVAPGDHRGPQIAELLRSRPVPTLVTIGWYDNCAVWSWPDVDALQTDSAWGANLWLRCEAIDHENNPYDAALMDGDTAKLVERTVVPSLDFFDFHLGRGGAEPDRVVYEVCNDGWRSAGSWPPAEATAATLHGIADSDGRRGTLSPVPSGEPGALTWRSDGVDLVPSVAANPFAMLDAERRDLARDTQRADVAALDGAPLRDPLTLAGPVDVYGTVQADRPSIDLFARLLDVAPDGTASLIVRGQLHLDGANGGVPFHLRMLHTAYRVAAGHVLRLHLASSDYPDYVPDPGDRSDPWLATAAVPTTVTVSTGAAQPLRLEYAVL